MNVNLVIYFNDVFNTVAESATPIAPGSCVFYRVGGRCRVEMMKDHVDELPEGVRSDTCLRKKGHQYLKGCKGFVERHE